MGANQNMVGPDDAYNYFNKGVLPNRENHPLLNKNTASDVASTMSINQNALGKNAAYNYFNNIEDNPLLKTNATPNSFIYKGTGKMRGMNADGGRIGYNRGRVVNPGGYAGEEEFEEFEDDDTLEFMRDQGVPYSEMAEGPSPFEMRVQELMEEGMSWQEAYTTAAEEFGMAEGGDSFTEDQGIASLV
jgi:hypothetical protein